MEIRPYREEDEQGVIRLWRACGLVVPWNDPAKDIRRKLRIRPEWFLVGTEEERIAASVMAGYDGHRGWIYYLAVDPDRRRSGLGRRMMEEAERILRAAGCPKINLQVRGPNREAVGFYENIGYVKDDVVSYGKRLVPDAPERRGGRNRSGREERAVRREKGGAG